MWIDNRSGGLRPPQQTKIPLARLYYPIWCCGGRRPPLRKRGRVKTPDINNKKLVVRSCVDVQRVFVFL